jgi:hypothetical protein
MSAFFQLKKVIPEEEPFLKQDAEGWRLPLPAAPA